MDAMQIGIAEQAPFRFERQRSELAFPLIFSDCIEEKLGPDDVQTSDLLYSHMKKLDLPDTAFLVAKKEYAWQKAIPRGRCSPPGRRPREFRGRR